MSRDESPLMPIRVLHDFAGRMEKLDIPYMLTGSMAMFQYSTYRMTADIDIVIDVLPRHADLLIRSLEPDYYIPHNSMKRAIEARRMFNVLNQETAFKVDCVILKKTPFHEKAFERRQSVDFHGKEIYIITLEDLIIAKLLWASESRSEKQLTDIRNLARNERDADYIKSWTRPMGVEDLYNECISTIG